MKFPVSWLKEHLATDADVATIADKLTAIGLEVEAVEDPAEKLNGFIVAKIDVADQHPDADRLHVCKVDIGAKEPLQIVCGAPNARAGIKVVLARPGCVVPATGDVLKTGKIRGVESFGMMCSARELGLSEEHDGIIELPESAVVGEPAAKALGMTDAVIDISITPNRGDCTSAYGVARDLAAAGLGTLKTPAITPVQGGFASPITVAVDFAGDKPACPIFAGRYIRGVKNGPSPKWVQERLKAIGLRPISALVDVTNLISHDRGRPLHVFDADKVQGKLVARLARDGEKLIALDGKEYALEGEMCVIADDAGPQSVAGVMGGEASGCTETTVNVFVESAFFEPVSVARTGRKLGLLSDARYRFERGVDPEFVVPGIELATQLILDWCGGAASEVVVAGQTPAWQRQITLAADKVKRLGGLDVPADKIVSILTSLGFVVEGSGPYTVTPPSWRSDIDGDADLVEEVVRIYGLEHVASVPMDRPHHIARPVLTGAQKRVRLARRALAARGFNETISFSFISRAHATLFGGGDDARQLANPITAELDALRPGLLPALLAAAARNLARGATDFALSEIGPAFTSGEPGAQTLVAAGIRVGKGVRDWTKTAHPADVFDAKADMLGVIETAMGAPMNAPVKTGAVAWYHPGRSGTLAMGPKVLAQFGELHPKVLAAFDIDVPVAAFEIFLDAIPEQKAKSKVAQALSPYQAVERDFAFVVDARVTADDLVKAVKGVDRNLIETVSLFDVYEGKGVAEGKKSLALSVRLQPKDKTLTDAEIEAVASRIVAAATKATGATLRA